MRNTAVDNEELARLATASRAVRSRRQNRLLLAKLLSSGSEEEDDEGDGEMAEDGGGKERQLMRLLAGSRILRQKRLRRLLIAHLLRERGESEDDESIEGEEDSGEEGSDRDRKLVRLLVASRLLRRRRVRRALLAPVSYTHLTLPTILRV